MNKFVTWNNARAVTNLNQIMRMSAEKIEVAENESVFIIYMKNGQSFKISQAEYSAIYNAMLRQNMIIVKD